MTTKMTLAERIEQGKPVKGVKGYVKLDYSGEDLYVPVTVQGMSVNTQGSCGIQIKVRPQGGFEDFTASPCDFIESKKEVNKLRASEQRINLAQTDYRRMARKPTANARKHALLDYVEAHGLQECYKQNLDEDNDRAREKVAELLIAKVHNLSPDEVTECHFYGWRS